MVLSINIGTYYFANIHNFHIQEQEDSTSWSGTTTRYDDNVELIQPSKLTQRKNYGNSSILAKNALIFVCMAINWDKVESVLPPWQNNLWLGFVYFPAEHRLVQRPPFALEYCGYKQKKVYTLMWFNAIPQGKNRGLLNTCYLSLPSKRVVLPWSKI